MGKSVSLIMAEKYINESGVPIANVARMVGISPSLLRMALRGEHYLGAERESRILETASAILKFKHALVPLDLPRGWEDLQKLMKVNSPERAAEIVDSLFG